VVITPCQWSYFRSQNFGSGPEGLDFTCLLFYSILLWSWMIQSIGKLSYLSGHSRSFRRVSNPVSTLFFFCRSHMSCLQTIQNLCIMFCIICFYLSSLCSGGFVVSDYRHVITYVDSLGIYLGFTWFFIVSPSTSSPTIHPSFYISMVHHDNIYVFSFDRIFVCGYVLSFSFFMWNENVNYVLIHGRRSVTVRIFGKLPDRPPPPLPWSGGQRKYGSFE